MVAFQGKKDEPRSAQKDLLFLGTGRGSVWLMPHNIFLKKSTKKTKIAVQYEILFLREV